MALDRAELQECLREELGCPSRTDLSDKALNTAINVALKKYSKFYPRLEDISVTVPVSGLVQADEDVLMIMAHSWSNSGGLDTDDLLGYQTSRDFVGSSPGFGSTSLRELSMDTFLDSYEINQVTDNVPKEVRLNGNQFEFMPSPKTDTVVLLRVGRLHTDSTFPERHLDELNQGSFARALRMMALRRHKFSSIKVGGENIGLRGTDGLFKEADRLWKEFISSLGPLRHAAMMSS